MRIWVFFACLLSITACKRTPDVTSPSSVTPPSVQLSTFLKAGWGYQDGPVGQAQFSGITGIAFDAADNLYVADYNNHRIRKITPDGQVSTFAGSGTAGLVDGPAKQAQFVCPLGLTFDAQGNLYVSQSLALRKITPDGTVSTVARTDYDGIGPLPDTTLFVYSQALAFDQTGNLFVTDYRNNYISSRILKLTPDKQFSVFVGVPFDRRTMSPSFKESIRQPNGLAFDSKGNLFVTDISYRVVKITPNGVASSYAGGPTIGYQDGPAQTALFTSAEGLAIDKQDNLYVGDQLYIRKITPDGQVSTIAGPSGKTTGDVPFHSTNTLAFDSKGDLYFSNPADGAIMKLTFPR